MRGVAELLATAGESAPIQRVREYHLSDRTASPRPRDFLTAMRETDGEVCVRLPDPSGDQFVRFAGPESGPNSDTGPNWERADPRWPRGPATVEAIDAERLRGWLREGRPELVAHEAVREAFEDPEDALPGVATDGGPKGRTAEDPILVRRYADLLADPALDRADAEALAGALPTGRDEVAVRIPLGLAEESVLRSVARSDRVFVAEAVSDRETAGSYYLRQGRRGCRVPKAEARVYELAGGASIGASASERSELV